MGGMWVEPDLNLPGPEALRSAERALHEAEALSAIAEQSPDLTEAAAR